MNHGTRYAWYQGCRCDECAEGRRAEDRKRRQSRKDRAAVDPSIVPHGRWGLRDYGCRCDICTTTNREENRRQRGNQPMPSWTEAQITEALRLYATEGMKAVIATRVASSATVRKWAQARGVECYRPPLVHGTRSAYTHRGCRCAPCVEGAKAELAQTKARLVANQEHAPHGAPSGYKNWGCRCDPCKDAGSIQNATTRRRRLARQALSATG